MKNSLLGIYIFALFCSISTLSAQVNEEEINQIKDSLYIDAVENKLGKPKVLHAEPLYIDLIRDLGARKGEKEWNVGLGLTDNQSFDEYLALVEYEWAPIDRLGLEVELPFSFFYPVNGNQTAPNNRLNSLKLSAQYTFLVSEKANTSLALGYIHEFELTDFNSYKNDRFVTGNIYNPFFVGAKRWGNNFHTLVYTGPMIFHHFADNQTHTSWQVNSNFHYMISGTRNFIGVEFNKEFQKNDFDMTIRPQMRLEVTKQIMIGIVTGIPIERENQRFSSFLRLIYEPGH